MNRRVLVGLGAIACMCGLLPTTSLQAAPPNAAELQGSAAELLPPSTLAFAEIGDPKALWRTVAQHPLRKQLEALPDYQRAVTTPEFTQFQLVISVIEQQIGMSWSEALDTLTAGGVAAAVDAQTQGAVLLLKADDPVKLARIFDTILGLVRDDARNKGQADPHPMTPHREVPVYATADGGALAVRGPWLILTNKGELCRRVLDNYLDTQPKSLATEPRFIAARANRGTAGTAWAYLDLSVLRSAGVAPKAFDGRAENPMAELLIGGILETLHDTPYLTASLEFGDKKLGLTLAAPRSGGKIDPERSYFFGPQEKGAAPAALKPHDTVLSLTAYRDLAGLWSHAADLFDKTTSAKFAEADDNLSKFFAGRDFVRDVLADLVPEIQFVAARRLFDAATAPVPEIKLPSLAIVFRVKKPESLEQSLKTAFQNLVGFANVTGAQSGMPQLELTSGKQGAAEIVSAAYVAPAAEARPTAGKLYDNFSPTLAFVGERMIVSSTRPLAVELAELASAERKPTTAADERSTVNTRLDSNLQVLEQVVADNRQQLITQNMAEKGHSREQAEKEIGILRHLLKVLGSASLKLEGDASVLRLNLGVDLPGSQP